MSQILGKFTSSNPANGLTMREDFLGRGIANTSWASTSSGTGATIATSNSLITFNRWGIVSASTGTTNTGRGSGGGGTIQLGQSRLVFYASVYFPTLSTVSEEYICDVGFHDQVTTSATPTEGIIFKYDRLTSTNWIVQNTNASTTTSTTTSTAVTAATWYDLIGIMKNNNTIEFYINGTLVATHTTNIPSGGVNNNPGLRIIKSAGTTALTVHLDYFTYQANFDTAR